MMSPAGRPSVASPAADKETHDIMAGRAECPPDADFSPALCDDIRDHAVDADDAEE